MLRLELHGLTKKRGKGAVEMKNRKESDEEKLKGKNKKAKETERRYKPQISMALWYGTKQRSFGIEIS